jgi:hypothetical protein
MALLPGAAAAKPGPVRPAASNAWGASLLTWQQRYIGWSLGSSDRPILTDSCGERIDGVFYLNSTPGTGIPKHLECRLRRGTRLLGSVGAVVALPRPGETDEQLLARLRGSDPAALEPRARLDGVSLKGAVARSLRFSKVYEIPLEPGNLAAMLEPSLAGASSTRVASFGWWLRLRPLRPGLHHLVFSTALPLAGRQKISFDIRVPRRWQPG